MTVRSSLAQLAGQITAGGLRLLGRQGTALPGLVATAIEPDFLRIVGGQLPSVLVSGTNGKTTTTNLLMRILASSGRSVVLNGEGSNLARGIASTLVSSPLETASIATFEVDEAELITVGRSLGPRLVVLMNLFRDQMDRYGELDATARRWQALEQLSETEVLVNADDPNLGWLVAQLKRTKTFGIQSVNGERRGQALALSHTADAVLSPVSHKRLSYRRISFSHLGDYRDPTSSFKRPALDYSIVDVKLRGLDGSSFTIQDHANRTQLALTTPMPGLFNVYNVAAAAIAAGELGIDRSIIESAVAQFTGAFGRFETIPLPNGRKLTIMLVKNPVGFDQALALIASIKTINEIVLGLNDKLADGTDVSWIWDVDFESLGQRRMPIVTTGTRAHELANRLHYAKIESKRLAVNPDLAHVVNSLQQAGRGTTVCCLTYTALLEFRRLLASHGYLRHQFASVKDRS